MKYTNIIKIDKDGEVYAKHKFTKGDPDDKVLSGVQSIYTSDKYKTKHTLHMMYLASIYKEYTRKTGMSRSEDIDEIRTKNVGDNVFVYVGDILYCVYDKEGRLIVDIEPSINTIYVHKYIPGKGIEHVCTKYRKTNTTDVLKPEKSFTVINPLTESVGMFLKSICSSSSFKPDISNDVTYKDWKTDKYGNLFKLTYNVRVTLCDGINVSYKPEFSESKYEDNTKADAIFTYYTQKPLICKSIIHGVKRGIVVELIANPSDGYTDYHATDKVISSALWLKTTTIKMICRFDMIDDKVDYTNYSIEVYVLVDGVEYRYRCVFNNGIEKFRYLITPTGEKLISFNLNEYVVYDPIHKRLMCAYKFADETCEYNFRAICDFKLDEYLDGGVDYLETTRQVMECAVNTVDNNYRIIIPGDDLNSKNMKHMYKRRVEHITNRIVEKMKISRDIIEPAIYDMITIGMDYETICERLHVNSKYPRMTLLSRINQNPDKVYINLNCISVSDYKSQAINSGYIGEKCVVMVTLEYGTSPVNRTLVSHTQSIRVLYVEKVGICDFEKLGYKYIRDVDSDTNHCVMMSKPMFGEMIHKHETDDCLITETFSLGTYSTCVPGIMDLDNVYTSDIGVLADIFNTYNKRGSSIAYIEYTKGDYV